eukprot:338765-Amphidinium_carterae.1
MFIKDKVQWNDSTRHCSHKLFAQVRSIKFELVDKYVVHADGMTKNQHRWGMKYNAAICQFGEV